MKTRTDLLNFLAEKYNLQRYLEIGVQDPKHNFDKIKCAAKNGVDPNVIGTPGIYQLTSDEFFHIHNLNAEHSGITKIFDLIFIDGLHTAEQVKKDFENSLKVLSPGGFIVLHDCNPEKEEHTIVPRPKPVGHWNGDVYRFACSILSYGFRVVDIDNGCGVFEHRDPDSYMIEDKPIVWGEFDKNRKELLSLISWEEFIKL